MVRTWSVGEGRSGRAPFRCLELESLSAEHRSESQVLGIDGLGLVQTS
jgi:hypothetical protein